VVGQAHLELVDPDDPGSKLFGRLHQLLVEPLDDRRHGNHRGGADEHAQHGEK